MVEADCVHAIFASFVSVARQGGGAPQSAVDHLKLLLKLAPKGRTGHHDYECQHLAFPLLQSPSVSLLPPLLH